MLEAALAARALPVVVLIRPRAGDFLYSAEEFTLLEREVELARELGAAGVALGLLTAEGELDEDRLARLVERAGPLAITFHRAFDQLADPRAAVTRLRALGVRRVLSSGGAATAEAGRARLRELVELTGDELEIVAAGTVRSGNVLELVQATGVRAVHLAARTQRSSRMHFRNSAARLGALEDDHDWNETDPAEIAAVVAALAQRSG